MKEKIKVKLLLFLIITVILNIFGIVQAHSVELDPDNLISFPQSIFNGAGKISISSSLTGYTLYYQAIEIPDEIYAQMDQTYETGTADLAQKKQVIDAMKIEKDNLEEAYNTARTAYNAKLEEDEPDPEELATLEEEYETAKNNYENKLNEYNNKINEYNTKVKEINEQIQRLTPTYVEENWIQMQDRSFNIDRAQFKGEKSFAIWIKLITSEGTTIYDESYYTVEGNKSDKIAVTGLSLDKSSLELKVGETYTLIATITPSNATNKNVIWESIDETVATISNGKITAKSVGTTTITATSDDGGFTATCELTVNPNPNSNTQNKPSQSNPQGGGTSTNKPSDQTTSGGNLPNTGTTVTIVTLMVVMLVVAIISYLKYHNYKDLK